MPLQKTATWIQSPFLSHMTKHRMKNEEIHKLFSELPEEEKLIDGKSTSIMCNIFSVVKQFVLKKHVYMHMYGDYKCLLAL